MTKANPSRLPPSESERQSVEPAFRPILFSGPMVRAILEGRKTQTRRVVKGLPEGIVCASAIPESDYQYRFTDFNGTVIDKRCPYGRPQLPLEPPRDRLWVRETFAVMNKVAFDARRPAPYGLRYKADLDTATMLTFRPSIFMPRWASRLTLEITDVRVERLQEINEDDCWHEGVSIAKRVGNTGGYVAQFREGWDALNAKRGYSWESNPWVWVVEFKKI